MAFGLTAASVAKLDSVKPWGVVSFKTRRSVFGEFGDTDLVALWEEVSLRLLIIGPLIAPIQTMETGCPAKCANFAIQKPLGVEGFSQLCNAARAEILLLEQTAWLCQSCGSVYVTSDSKPVLIDRLPALIP